METALRLCVNIKKRFASNQIHIIQISKIMRSSPNSLPAKIEYIPSSNWIQLIIQLLKHLKCGWKISVNPCVCLKKVAHQTSRLRRYFTAMSPLFIRGCSHITSAKIRGSWTTPPPLVSNGQHLAYPPSPLVSNGQHLTYPPSPPRQLSSAFARRPFCTTIFYVDLFTW